MYVEEITVVLLYLYTRLEFMIARDTNKHENS